MTPTHITSNGPWQLLISLLILSSLSCCHGWVPAHARFLARQHQSMSLWSSTTINSIPEAQSTQSGEEDDDDDDDEEYEYVEYDILTEQEFMGSEWLIGTVMDKNPKKIDETWVRLATDKDGKNVAIWGDGAQGTWSLDVANQFLSMSKEGFFGKDIWAGIVDDYYFTMGTVRGWSFISPAAVLGQWQAKRLGVMPEEAGPAPWFESDDDDDDNEEEKQEEESPKLEAKSEENAGDESSTPSDKTEATAEKD